MDERLQSNTDMLAWFSEEEREACSECGQPARVGVQNALASFCLSCGAITVEGRRIDLDGRLVA